jgi:hypothetical protein
LRDSPLPETYAPPWNHTMTGNRSASLGAVRLSTRQSSLTARPVVAGPVTNASRDGNCGQAGPRSVSTRGSVQAGRAVGAPNRAAVP